uniref:RRM domain-containing protein n=1 Tax=Sphenodon punctatus TaxID=8508 RepID=A0A8D0GKM5_SPHPU
MFSPRALPQRPRPSNPSGSDPQGAFKGPGAAGVQRKPAPRMPQGIPQRFVGQETVQSAGFQRPGVGVAQRRTDPRQAREGTNFGQQQKKGKLSTTRWDIKQVASRMRAQNSNVQGRYTNESASSILASFGLSNEDLEELSRYPDDQLTPENMPLILREIRMRKMGRHLPSLPPQSRGKETLGGGGSSMVKSKVIDYGHESKYGYTEDPFQMQTYNPEVPTDETKEFQQQQALSSNPLSAVVELIRQMGFHAGASNAQSFFSTDASKIPGLCITPSGLPGVKPSGPPAMAPGPMMQQPGMQPPMQQSGMQPPGMQPPMQQPGMQPPMQQHGMQPGMQPPMQQPGMQPPMLQQPGMQPPGMQQPGMQQPMSQPGMQPPMMPPPMMPPPMSQHGMPPPGMPPPMSQPGMPPPMSQPPPFSAERHEAANRRERLQHDCRVFSQADAQKMKRLPTPSIMNDYYAASPRIFPHMCSLCNVECRHLKDWFQHQNTPAHIESCRQLRQQYPDWNPEAQSSSKRNAGDRKENQTPRRHSNSPSSRHSRGSGSGHASRRSRSQSRSPGRNRPAGPRSRSPRHTRRPSPRHRSRSPQRSRNQRSSPRPQRSPSTEWGSGRSNRSPGKLDKEALEAFVKCLGAGFVAEFNKQKFLQASGQGTSGPRKTPPDQGVLGRRSGNVKMEQAHTPLHQKASKGDLFHRPDASNSKVKLSETAGIQEKEGTATDKSLSGTAARNTSSSRPAPYNRLLRDQLLSCGTVLHISDLPDDGFSDQDIKKIVQPFGKVSDLLVLRSRNEAFLEMNYKEAVMAAVKYGETVPVLVNGKRVKISVAEKPKAAPSPVQSTGNVKKTSPNIKKPAPNTKEDKSSATVKTTKEVPPPPRASLTKTGQTGNVTKVNPGGRFLIYF